VRSFDTPEIGLENAWIGLDSGRKPFHQLLSELHHDQAVDEVHKEAHIVLDEQDGEAFITKSTQKAGKILLFAVPKPGGRLIKEQ
jgi:hypothetical protein